MTSQEIATLLQAINGLNSRLDKQDVVLDVITKKLDPTSEAFILKEYVPIKNSYQLATGLGKAAMGVLGFFGLLGGSLTLIPTIVNLIWPQKP